MGTIILKGYQFVNTGLRINCSLQTQLVAQTWQNWQNHCFQVFLNKRGSFLLLATYINNILAKSFQTLFELIVPKNTWMRIANLERMLLPVFGLQT